MTDGMGNNLQDAFDNKWEHTTENTKGHMKKEHHAEGQKSVVELLLISQK